MVHGDNYQSYSMPVLGVPWQWGCPNEDRIFGDFTCLSLDIQMIGLLNDRI